MSKETVLIVEDELDIQELINYNLEKEGYKTICLTRGEEVPQKVLDFSPAVILLDIMLPGMDGLEVCKLLKQNDKTRGVPVIMLTAKSDESDIVTGLEVGAEDYITKPFSVKVLIARVRAVLRRRKEKNGETEKFIKIHNIIIDDMKHEVKVEGQPVLLSATEYNILKLLASKPGWVFSRSRIINSIKGDNYPVTERSVDVQILGLRKNLGSQGQLIETVRGVGYKLKEE